MNQRKYQQGNERKMGCNKKSNKFLLFVSCMLLSFGAYSQDSSNPQFSDYLVPVSNGPFERNIHFNKEQENYSSQWKNAVEEELKKPVNFAGHFRIYTAFGGQGKECLRDNWVCGWVIDKTTGEVVSTLPTSPEGGNSYAEAVDNGTSDGLKFKVIASKDRTSLTITGRAVNAPLRDANGDFSVPECRSIKYNFDGKEYTIIKEDDNGCNLSKEIEIYGK